MTDRAKLRKLAERAKRGRLVNVVASANPPSVILILSAEGAIPLNYRDARAIADFVREFTPSVALELLK